MNRSSFLRSNTYVRTMNELDLTTVADRSDEAMEGMYFDNVFKIFLLGSIQSDWITTDELGVTMSTSSFVPSSLGGS